MVRIGKEVPESFEARTHSADTLTIEPGETKYFEMELSFPPFSTGEYWIEAIGQREYGLLDPFWQSTWRYKKPITIDNTSGTTSTEQQVFLELDSSDSDFWSNVQSRWGRHSFLREVAPEQVWYNSAWSERLPITIQASQIDDDITNLPVYVDLSDLGTISSPLSKLMGRIFASLLTMARPSYPMNLVSIDTSAETGELHFRASTTIASTTDTTFYLYYGTERQVHTPKPYLRRTKCLE